MHLLSNNVSTIYRNSKLTFDTTNEAVECRGMATSQFSEWLAGSDLRFAIVVVTAAYREPRTR